MPETVWRKRNTPTLLVGINDFLIKIYALGKWKICVTLLQYSLYCSGLELSLKYLLGMPVQLCFCVEQIDKNIPNCLKPNAKNYYQAKSDGEEYFT